MYSSIKRKTCKCGCGKNPTLGYGGYKYSCAPQEIKDKVGSKRDVAKRNKNARNRASLLLKRDNDADKTKLLQMADKLFSDYIKMRDSNEQGFVTCVCCGLHFHLKDKDASGNYIVQTLHFIERGVYVLRHYEYNASAGCCYCNLQMHLNPHGKEYVAFRNKLVATIGEVKVSDMEAAKRGINKLTTEDLKSIIEKYKPKNNHPSH